MKKIMTILVMLILTIGSFAQDDIVLSSFEKITTKFEKFFANSNDVVDKQDFPKSPTSYTFSLHRFYPATIAYDVKKTESLVSPYTAYIELKCLKSSNHSDGDIRFYYDVKIKQLVLYSEDMILNTEEKESMNSMQGFGCANEENALKLKINEDNKELEKITFMFAYQNKKWVLKNILNGNNEQYIVLCEACGIIHNNHSFSENSQKINDVWKILAN
jgi:hypothetical protein